MISKLNKTFIFHPVSVSSETVIFICIHPKCLIKITSAYRQKLDKQGISVFLALIAKLLIV